MKADIEKAFDFINHSFLMCVLKKFGCGNNFRKWIQILRENPVLSMVVKQHGTLSLKEKLNKETNFDISLYYSYGSSSFFN